MTFIWLSPWNSWNKSVAESAGGAKNVTLCTLEWKLMKVTHLQWVKMRRKNMNKVFYVSHESRGNKRQSRKQEAFCLYFCSLAQSWSREAYKYYWIEFIESTGKCLPLINKSTLLNWWREWSDVSCGALVHWEKKLIVCVYSTLTYTHSLTHLYTNIHVHLWHGWRFSIHCFTVEMHKKSLSLAAIFTLAYERFNYYFHMATNIKCRCTKESEKRKKSKSVVN